MKCTIFTVAVLFGMVTVADADLFIREWAHDTLSAAAPGNVNVSANGFSTITKTLTNTTTSESVGVTVAASSNILKGVGGGGGQQFLAVDSTGTDDVNFLDSAGTNGPDFFTFAFNAPVQIKYLDFEEMDWDTNGGNADGYVFVEVRLGGTLEHTLFGSGAVVSEPGFTGATGAIKADSGNIFNVAWDVPAGTLVEFRYGQGGGSVSPQRTRLDDIGFGVSPVPEPSAFLFGALVCGVVGSMYGGRKWLAARHK